MKQLVLFSLVLLLGSSLLRAQDNQWLKGFAKSNAGEYIGYKSAIEGVDQAIMVRSINSERYIEWETEPIPARYHEEIATFAWLADYDSTLDMRTFNLSINGEYILTFTNSPEKNWRRQGPMGITLTFKHVQTDNNGDYMGYMFLSVPVSRYPKGQPLTLRVTGESAGQRTWYMTFMDGLEPTVELMGEQALIREGERLRQRIRIDMVHHGDPTKVVFRLPGAPAVDETLNLGRSTFYLPVDAVDESTDFTVEIQKEGYSPRHYSVTLKPVRKFVVYFLPHSHVDIGYTHLQSEVEKMQWRNLEEAIELARQTAGYPDGARYRWNGEVLWAVDSYLRQAAPEKRQALVDAIHQGWIGIDGLFGNELTGLMKPEELFRAAGENASATLSKYNIPVTTAMITDVPGYSWGLVPALARNGIKYFSIGPNHIPALPHQGDRVGYTLEAWGDIPFYWESPSGKERVLCWMTSHGYSWFHGWILGRLTQAGGAPILQHLTELDEKGYPYDMVQLRYTVGADNGPPDPEMPDFIRQWNETYEWPKMRIATTRELFEEFEQKYGDMLPVVRGDFTPYWEDGAASSARETAINRQTSERLVQAEILWSMLRQPDQYPHEAFEEAWRNVLLYSEHTWGAHSSRSEPDSKFTRSLWEVKKSMALDAFRQTEELLSKAIAPMREGNEKVKNFQVFNTSSWTRTDLVTLPARWDLSGTVVIDARGREVPSQRLSTGELAFVATDIPAMGSAAFTLKASTGDLHEKGIALATTTISVEVDPESGAIHSLHRAGVPVNFVDTTILAGLNAYFYTGLNAENPRTNGKVRITITENGPVLHRLLLESDAPGCRWMTREITLVEGLDHFILTNTIDKEDIRENENVRFAFPFHVPDGHLTMDLAWGVMTPEQDQLRGSNKNYFSGQRWVDLSNDRYGLTWVNLDAPLIELGGMTGEAWMDEPSRPWIREYQPTQLIYSWVMNNSWHTNYKASQDGITTFRYILRPHVAFDIGETKRFGIACNQPLLAVPSSGEAPTPSLVTLEGGTNTIVTSLRPSFDGKGYLLRIFNAGTSAEKVSLHWQKPGATLFLSSSKQEKGPEVNGFLSLAPWEIQTLKIELSNP